MKNKIQIFAINNCLTEQALVLYAQQQLPNTDIRLVEEHLCHCELCSDAIDGYMQLNHEEQNNLVANLKNPFKVNENLKVGFYKKNKWALVAGITLLLGIGGYAYNHLNVSDNNTKIAETTSVAKDHELQPTNIVQLPTTTQTENKNTKKEIEPNENLHKENKKEEYKKTESIIVKNEEKTIAPVTKQIPPQSAPVPKTQNEIANKPTIPNQVEKSNAIADEVATVKSVEPPSVKNKSYAPTKEMRQNVYPSAIQNNDISTNAYQNNNAKKIVDNTASDDKSAMETNKGLDAKKNNFANGFQFFQQKNYAKALQLLNKNTDNTKKDETQYYIALCHFYLGNTTKAKTLLEKIIATNTAYSEQASSFLAQNYK